MCRAAGPREELDVCVEEIVFVLKGMYVCVVNGKAVVWYMVVVEFCC